MQLSSVQPVPNVYGTAIQGFGMFLHNALAGAQSPTYLMHNMQANSAGLQGYPIISNYVEQAWTQQYYNLPRVNLLFRSEQMSQNLFQGYPVGSERQVHTSSEQVQSRQSSHRAVVGINPGTAKWERDMLRDSRTCGVNEVHRNRQNIYQPTDGRHGHIRLKPSSSLELLNLLQ